MPAQRIAELEALVEELRGKEALSQANLQRAWAELRKLGLVFAVVLSDALHTPDALVREWVHLRDDGLLPVHSGYGGRPGMAQPWFLVWDDAQPDLVVTIASIVANARATAGPSTPLYSRLLRLNGWLGNNEAPHPVAVLSNVPLDFIDAAGSIAVLSDDLSYRGG